MSDESKDPEGAQGDPAQDEAAAQASDASPAADAAAGERRDLPKWNRARVKRKAPQGEEQDAFQTSVRRAGRGFLQRPIAVLGLIVAVGGIAAGIYAWQQSREADKAEATAVLATAVAYEARGMVMEDLATQLEGRVRPPALPVVASSDELRKKVDTALGDLEELAPDSDANATADLVRAARLARARDFAGAEAAYRGFLQRQPGHALVYLAREGLVICLEAQERYDDALAEVEPMLGEAGDFYRDQALWHRGRLLEAAGRTDEALEVYKTYAAEYPLDKPSLALDGVRARMEVLDPGSVPPEPELDLGALGGFAP